MSALPEASDGQERTGGALFRATGPYAKEDQRRTWLLFVQTLAVWTVAAAGALLAPLWPVQLVASIIAGLTIVRLFIFFHDAMHGAVFRDSKLGGLFMQAVGILTLNPPSVWKQTHDYHHRNNAKILGASIGSFPVLTTGMWKELSPEHRRMYRIARSPWLIVFAYFTVFAIGMCISAFRRAPKEHWQGPVALAVHIGLAVGVGLTLGWTSAFFGVVFPLFLACMLGAYLFYAQHNFPDIELRERRTWDYTFAAIRSSSMFDMSSLMHWFTGNIGYHHVHHLNHRIPFYRLPEAMAAIPELQRPGRTSWRPRDVLACLRLKLWDPKAQKMVGWPE